MAQAQFGSQVQFSIPIWGDLIPDMFGGGYGGYKRHIHKYNFTNVLNDVTKIEPHVCSLFLLILFNLTTRDTLEIYKNKRYLLT